jgi:hypothetical protein
MMNCVKQDNAFRAILKELNLKIVSKYLPN